MAQGNLDVMTKLNASRGKIQQLDMQILSLLSRRQAVAASIGELKEANGMDVYDPERERDVLDRLVSKGDAYLTPECIRHIFSEIVSAARTVQGPLRVAFLGPEDTFTHNAATCLFGNSTSFHPVETIQEVFQQVEKGVCQRGVVPVENSYEGSVVTTLDCLYRYDLKVEAEILLRIRHHLLSRANETGRIQKLYSHPLALAQCRLWIKEHLPDVPLEEVSSTAMAAGSVAGKPNAAAVGSRFAAHHYGLNLLAENIEDYPGNVTRFLVIGDRDAEPSGKDKTSIVFSLRHEPGSLYRALGPLARAEVNMTRIESRPVKTRSWEYLFFVDFEGHQREERISEALKEMESGCAFLKRLGSYPSGGDPCD